MFPILYENHFFLIPSWHVLFITGTLSGYFYFSYLCKTFQESLLTHAHSIFLISYTSGLAGARLFSLCVEEDIIELKNFFHFDSLTFYGSVLGALVGLSVFSYFKKINFLTIFDLIIGPLFLGLGFGRIGCFLNGDDFGVPVSSSLEGSYPWWTYYFTKHGDLVPRYPVQIIESLYAFFLVLVLRFKYIRIYQLEPGLLGCLGAMFYCVFRFWIEYLRDDTRGHLILKSLSSAQSLSLVFIILISFCFLSIKKGVLIENLYKNRRQGRN